MKYLAVFMRMVCIAVLFLVITGCTPSEYQKGVKNYKPDDAVAAVRELKPIAEQGHAEAQFNLGSLYYQGWGVPQDYNEAIKWFRKAAEQSHVSAQMNLAAIYADGVQGVIAQDYPQALMWLIFAAAQGNRDAMQLRDSLAVKMTPTQISEAQKLAREFKPTDAYVKLLQEVKALAEQGDPAAQFKTGLMYYYGQGAPQDFMEALKWLRKSALQGNPSAQYNVGYMYEKGEGAPQDYVEASQWYRKAAERGNQTAQFNLGYMYEKGQGIQQDEVQALKWYNLAAAQGEVKAKAARDRVTVWMTPAQIAEAQRQAREFKTVGK